MKHIFTIGVLVVLSAAIVVRAEPLPSDDRLVRGEFSNGLDYIIRHNTNPPGRVMLYLHVKTGALNETDVQNGLAHFLEHMAFNGSKHFEPGTLVPLLESLGMRFGADTNAHTTLWETVYKLNLPDTKPETIDLGLKIFADYASGLTLLETEIDDERKVILEESRARKSAGQRIERGVMKQVYSETRLATHDVIGDEEQIKTFPRDQFVDYWDTWYRPENMTLIVVGDVKAEDILPVAEKWLGEFKARAESRQPTKAGLKPTTEGRGFVFTDPEQVLGNVELTAIVPGRKPASTFEEYREQTVESIATAIVDRRLRDMITKGGAPFRQAEVGIGDFMDEGVLISGEASGEPEEWNNMLDALIVEISRAIEHGFLPGELELIKRGMLESAEQRVRTDATRDSSSVIGEISRSVGLDAPLLSASQRLELVKRIAETVTVDELHKVFAARYSTRNYNYILRLPEKKEGFTVPSSEDVLAAANAAWMKKTDPPAEKQSVDQLLPSEPDPGQVISQATDEELGITNLEFANGVVMHHKFSDYKKDQVIVRIILPGGSIEETAETKGLTELAMRMLGQLATSRYSSTEIRDLLTGKSVSFGGGSGIDSVVLSVSGNPKDLAMGMQLAYAALTDGRLEQSAVDNWKRARKQVLARMKLTPSGQLQEAMARTFYGGDPRLTPLTEEQIDRLQREDAEAWFRRIASEAPIEVTVVGDISLEQATELVARYLGSLPKRIKGFDALDELRKLNREAGPIGEVVRFESVTPQAIAVAGFVSCDALDPDRRPLALAARVLTDRMIQRLREKEQLVYSIGAYNQPGTGLPGIGLFVASSTTDPQNGERLADTILEMMRDFAETGPTEAELASAKKQTMTELETSMREPSWWVTQIDEMRYRGRPLEDLKVLPGVFETFTADDLQAAVVKYLKDEAVVRYVIIPEKSEAAPAPATVPATQPVPAAVE